MWYNLNKSKNIHLFKEVVNIWDEMSYNYYWAYREVDFRDRLNTEPDFQDMEYDYELEDWVTEEYEVEVPYTYYICTVKL